MIPVYNQCQKAVSDVVDDSREICNKLIGAIAEARFYLEKTHGMPQTEKKAHAIAGALNTLIEIHAKVNTSAALPEHWLR